MTINMNTIVNNMRIQDFNDTVEQIIDFGKSLKATNENACYSMIEYHSVAQMICNNINYDEHKWIQSVIEHIDELKSQLIPQQSKVIRLLTRVADNYAKYQTHLTEVNRYTGRITCSDMDNLITNMNRIREELGKYAAPLMQLIPLEEYPYAINNLVAAEIGMLLESPNSNFNPNESSLYVLRIVDFRLEYLSGLCMIIRKTGDFYYIRLLDIPDNHPLYPYNEPATWHLSEEKDIFLGLNIPDLEDPFERDDFDIQEYYARMQSYKEE